MLPDVKLDVQTSPPWPARPFADHSRARFEIQRIRRTSNAIFPRATAGLRNLATAGIGKVHLHCMSHDASDLYDDYTQIEAIVPFNSGISQAHKIDGVHSNASGDVIVADNIAWTIWAHLH